MAAGACWRVRDAVRCDNAGGPRASDACFHRCAGHPLLAMSIILDALRRGRGKQTPQMNSNAAQTDAVLQTLGYGRFNATSPFNRLKRILGYFALTVLFAIVLWGAVIWITLTYFGAPAVDENTMVLQGEPIPAPDSVPAPPTNAPDGTSTSAGTAAVDKPVTTD